MNVQAVSMPIATDDLNLPQQILNIMYNKLLKNRLHHSMLSHQFEVIYQLR